MVSFRESQVAIAVSQPSPPPLKITSTGAINKQTDGQAHRKGRKGKHKEKKKKKKASKRAKNKRRSCL